MSDLDLAAIRRQLAKGAISRRRAGALVREVERLRALWEEAVRAGLTWRDERDALAATVQRVREVQERYFDLDVDPFNGEPLAEDGWRFDRDLRAALGGGETR